MITGAIIPRKREVGATQRLKRLYHRRTAVRALRAFEHSMSQFSKSLLAFRDRPIVFGKRAAVAVAREVIAHDMTRKCRTEIVDRVAAYKLEGSLDFLARTA